MQLQEKATPFFWIGKLIIVQALMPNDYHDYDLTRIILPSWVGRVGKKFFLK